MTVKADPSRPWVRVSRSGAVSIDLSAQWAGDLPRNQGLFGTCTAFAAVAIYEAAAARERKCMRLSEADAFLQANVLRWGCWDGRESCTNSLEGFNIAQMSQHIRTKGVLVGDDYHTYMARYSQALSESETRGSRTRGQNWFSAFLSNPFAYGPLFNHERSEVRKYLESYAAYSGSGDLDVQRRAVAAKFSRYTRNGKAFRIRPDSWNTGERFCRGEAREQEDFIDGELLEGRPVAVQMYLKGLPSWGQELSTTAAGHAFVIQGVYAGPGFKFYATRNSWGRENPDVNATELCRIDYAESVLVPGERPGPADGLAVLWRGAGAGR